MTTPTIDTATHPQVPDSPAEHGGQLWLWFLVALAPVGAVLSVAIRMLRQTHDEAPLDFDQWLAYVSFLVVATIGPFVMALLLRRLTLPLREARSEGRSRWLSPLGACLALSITVSMAALLTYKLGSDFVTASAMRRLQAVATLKASLVKAWLDDTRDDIRLSVESPALFQALADWRASGAQDSPARQRLVEHLWRLSRTLHYVEIGLHDATTGALLLTSGDDEDTPSARRQAIAAAAVNVPLLEEFHVESDNGRAPSLFLGRFAAIAPPNGADRVVVHVGIDPHHSLFPLVEQWPGSSSTAEVLLMRREGRAMQVLNDTPLRHASSDRHADDDSAPRGIAAALMGGEIADLRGTDDRGHAVLAHAVPVDGTSWFVVAKMDESEAYAELDRITILAASIVGALLMLGAWWWVESYRHRVAELQRQMERIEQARRMAELSHRLVSVQEEERRRWSSELHDRVGANLAAINLNLKAIARAFPAHGGEDRELLDETSHLLSDTVVSIREFCSELRPAILDYAGLVPAIQSSGAQIERRTGVRVRFDHTRFDGRCGVELETMLFRIVQEALLNCGKHAHARTVDISLVGGPDHLLLSIEDDGVGFDGAQIGMHDAATGQGLLNMRERASFIGGKFTLVSRPGHGTQVRVEWSRAPTDRDELHP